MKLVYKTLKGIGFLCLGVLGAAIFELLILPHLLGNPFFGKNVLLKNLQREIITYPVQRIIVQEGAALKPAIEQVENAVFAVQGDKKVQGCGFAVTSDGLVAVAISLLPAKGDTLSFNGIKTKFQVLGRDVKNGLVLLKIEKSNLKTTSFADPDNTAVGERVFVFKKTMQAISTSSQNNLSSSDSSLDSEEQFIKSVNEGIIKSKGAFGSSVWETNISEIQSFDLCPMFNFQGEFVGLSKFMGLSKAAEKGDLGIVPNTQVRSLVDKLAY